MRASGNKRQRGAYFTPKWVAKSLADWAIRTPHDQVVDPAAGRGDLLIAAAERLAALGGKLPAPLFGIELHSQTVRALRTALAAYVPDTQLLHGDFFSLASKLPACDVVLANPPYVRHQEIPARSVTLMREALDGRGRVVAGKASAWAYFLVHALSLLRKRGRLAFVLPSEVLTSDYSPELLTHLGSVFKTVRLIHCHGVVFRDLNQQAVLCLADGYDASGRSVGAVEWASVGVKSVAPPHTFRLGQLECEPIRAGTTLMRLLAPRAALRVEQQLRDRAGITPLGELASVGIGYVTGNNRFFQITDRQRKRDNLSIRHLTRVVTRSRGLNGIAFTSADWEELRAKGEPCWLFAPKNAKDKRVRMLLQRGSRAEVPAGYKCGNRSPWWKVKIGQSAPALMVYMGARPGVRANSAPVRVPNSLYELRQLRGISAENLAVASVTSVFQLCAALNARILGGGLRKLEPSDAARVLVPAVAVTTKTAGAIDRLLRKGDLARARDVADEAILVRRLGWSKAFVRNIRSALASLEAGS